MAWIFLPVLAFGQSAGNSPANSYDSIITRNVFALKPPPALSPSTTAPEPQKPLPELTLTGIADFSLKKWALIVSAERGKPPKLYTLSEGQQLDGLAVLAIDAIAGTVRLRLDGNDVTLSFKEQDQKQLVTRAETQKFVNEHTRAHELHEKREAERRAIERQQAELAIRQTHVN